MRGRRPCGRAATPAAGWRGGSDHRIDPGQDHGCDPWRTGIGLPSPEPMRPGCTMSTHAGAPYRDVSATAGGRPGSSRSCLVCGAPANSSRATYCSAAHPHGRPSPAPRPSGAGRGIPVPTSAAPAATTWLTSVRGARQATSASRGAQSVSSSVDASGPAAAAQDATRSSVSMSSWSATDRDRRQASVTRRSEARHLRDLSGRKSPRIPGTVHFVGPEWTLRGQGGLRATSPGHSTPRRRRPVERWGRSPSTRSRCRRGR